MRLPMQEMQETQVRFLDFHFPEKEMATTPLFLHGKSYGQRSLAGYSPWGRKRVRHNLATKEQPPPPVDCRKKKKQKTMVNDFPGKQSPKDGIHHVL